MKRRRIIGIVIVLDRFEGVVHEPSVVADGDRGVLGIKPIVQRVRNGCLRVEIVLFQFGEEPFLPVAPHERVRAIGREVKVVFPSVGLPPLYMVIRYPRL